MIACCLMMFTEIDTHEEISAQFEANLIAGGGGGGKRGRRRR